MVPRRRRTWGWTLRGDWWPWVHRLETRIPGWVPCGFGSRGFGHPGLPRWLSCAAELEDSRSGQQKLLAALSRNPTLLKQFRPVLEDTLEEKLESMGIKRVSSRATVAGPVPTV